jgi:ribose transport system ATP-binding protein
VALVCDRASVLHNGRIVAELPADAGENALLSAAHGLGELASLAWPPSTG